MKVVYTKHALKKFKFLESISWKFTKSDIENALVKPDDSGVDEERQAEFVLKEIDEKHELRVIYRKSNDIITVITFYPTGKGRYSK